MTQQERTSAAPNSRAYRSPEAVEPKRGSEATKPWEKERPGAEGMQPRCSQAAPPAVAQSLYTLYTQSVILDGLNVLALVLNVVGCDIRP